MKINSNGILVIAIIFLSILSVFSLTWAIVEYQEIQQFGGDQALIGRIEGGYAITQYMVSREKGGQHADIYIYYVNPRIGDQELFNVEGVSSLGIHFGSFLNNSNVDINITVQGKGEIGNLSVPINNTQNAIIIPVDPGTTYMIKVTYHPNKEGKLVIVNMKAPKVSKEGAPAIP